MNPAIIFQTIARLVYNRSDEPLGHFSDTQPTDRPESAKQEWMQIRADRHAAAVSQLKTVGVVLVIAVIVGVVFFR